MLKRGVWKLHQWVPLSTSASVLRGDKGGKNEICPGNSHGSFQDHPLKEVESVTGSRQGRGRQGGPGTAARVLRAGRLVMVLTLAGGQDPGGGGRLGGGEEGLGVSCWRTVAVCF